jgi:hypothetical protein
MDIYDQEQLEEWIDDDEINSAEGWFMQGYLDEL